MADPGVSQRFRYVASPLGRAFRGEFAAELAAAESSFQCVAIDGGFELDFHGAAVAVGALFGPGNGVAGNGGIVSFIAALRFVGHLVAVAVLGDHQSLRAAPATTTAPAAAFALIAGLCVALPVATLPALASTLATLPAGQHGHLPGADKIRRVLRRDLQRQHRKQQKRGAKASQSEPNLFGVIHHATSRRFRHPVVWDARILKMYSPAGSAAFHNFWREEA